MSANISANTVKVGQCSLPLDRKTGRNSGSAFVELTDDASEQKAIHDLQDAEWMGHMIRCQQCQPSRAWWRRATGEQAGTGSTPSLMASGPPGRCPAA
ncbi:RNA-binding protein RbpD [Synechococcus sp. WH 5701]|uniref:RNA-binding protein n=1 Tax=Synechococcus sp. CCFWC 502 TaxID=2978474 RepID=UPI0000699691|nr:MULTISPECIES: RNA-binding protein [unclassified Synechococcus]EAQ75191.1 RNA-binding protein RbpD [Synechococcus sp. WH 5701]WFN60480.1 RNA-binding protein [Synechococcus sp. CCFWC 502]